MVAAVSIPVTVKIRAGWEEGRIAAADITEIAEKAGAKAITIHGRTREQGYRGEANWDYIRMCKERAKKILVIGNGDLFTATNVMEMFAKTGCDAVLLARGTMGGPHLIEEVYRLAEGEEAAEAPLEALFRDHFAHVCSYANERKALIDLRRISCWYLKNSAEAKKMRDELMKADSLKEVERLLAL